MKLRKAFLARAALFDPTWDSAVNVTHRGYRPDTSSALSYRCGREKSPTHFCFCRQGRKGIKSNIMHGEEGSLTERADEQMPQLERFSTAIWHRIYIFNCDEKGLMWRKVPGRSLTTRGCLEKRRKGHAWPPISAAMQTGRKDWFIGTAKTPRCFSTIDVENMSVKWRHNKKAWMTGSLMGGWIRWFDARMAGREVVLLMRGCGTGT